MANIVAKNAVFAAPTAKQGAVGRIYLTFLSVSLLMLTAWHFAIQSAAHDAALIQVRSWMQSLGMTVDSVQYRLLRGALTMQGIKANPLGQPLAISSVFMKGNPASLATNNPLIHLLRIEDVRFDAGANDAQSFHTTLPESLIGIFRYAHTLTLRNMRISNLKNIPDVQIQDIQVTGPNEARKIFGLGFLQIPENTWSLSSMIPADIAQQSGTLKYTYGTMLGEADWTGAWSQKNVNLHITQTLPGKKHAKAELTQKNQQWIGQVDLQSWLVKSPQLQATISGLAQVQGTAEQWTLQSPALDFEAATLLNYPAQFPLMHWQDVEIDIKNKSFNIGNAIIHDTQLNLNPNAALPTFGEWKGNIGHLAIEGLQASIALQETSLQLPNLSGTASVQDSKLTFDVTGRGQGNNYWRLQQDDSDKLHVIASDVPLIQLRNLLPQTLRQNVSTFEGSAELSFDFQPSKQWQMQGQVQAKDIRFANKEQNLSASMIDLHISDANVTGVSSAALTVNDWFLQLPINPSQAWSRESQFEAWSKIPWAFSDINLQHGDIAFGQAEQVWLSDADVHVVNWQSSDSSLTLNGKFGMEPLTLTMDLSNDADNEVSWTKLQLQTSNANLSPVSSWLDISGYPSIEQGHITLDLYATKAMGNIEGNATITFDRLVLFQGQQSKLTNGTYADVFTQVLQQGNNISLSVPFAGDGDWSQLAATTFMQTLATPSAINISPTKPSHQARLGSLRIHQGQGLSLNERTRIRKMLRGLKASQAWHLVLTPDFGTAQPSQELHDQVARTQQRIKAFLNRQGISSRRIFPILAQEKHHSTSAAGAVHIDIIKE